MKLYYHPVSTTSRPILLFAADHHLELETQVVDLMSGEHHQPAYAAINPSRLVPVLEDGDFRLTECSAILKYLADKVDSPTYPKDLRKRARVNERMDWLNSNFYRDWGYGLIYPQVFPHHHRPTGEQQAGVVAWGKEKSRGWLKILDENLLGPGNAYLCGDQLTLADYMGAAYLTAGEIVGCRFDAYPNISRWLAKMKSGANWVKVNAALDGLVAAMKDKQFEAV